MLYKGGNTEIVDVDEKGTVVFYASVFGNKDSYGDIVMPGAFSKTIAENGKNIKHYKNHDGRKMPGVIVELEEDAKGLKAKSNLILGTQLGRETYEEYKAMAAAGKSMPHSFGYWTIKSDYDKFRDANLLRELKVDELSTLTLRPANEEAVMVALKSMGIDELIKEDKYLSILLNAQLKDASLEKIEAMRKAVITALDERAAKLALDDVKPQSSLFARASQSY